MLFVKRTDELIPTYKDGVWDHTYFSSRGEMVEFLEPLFKEPGEYNFDETSLLFNREAKRFVEQGEVYCLDLFRSKDFNKYWDTQKERCRKGVIFHSNNNTWYLPGDYYMWLNFLPIFNKEIKAYGFADVRDAQYHMALYECLAELNYEHSAILKKRQIASSYYHMGKLANAIWFEEGVVLKMGASLKDYVNDMGSWSFLDEYKNFLNDKTAWYRPMNPGAIGKWQQKIEVKINGRTKEIGNKGTLKLYSFENSPTKGVGGPTTYFFYEEAGIAPTMDKTFEFLKPAMESGDITTGMFICAGSVGDLKECKPLADMLLRPYKYNIRKVKHKWFNPEGVEAETALFIPEQWSMPPYIDEYGNSKVAEALEAIKKRRIKEYEELDVDIYNLRVSQKPTNIEEALAVREESRFPQHLVKFQERKIKDKDYYFKYVIPERDPQTGKVVLKPTNKAPIDQFPIEKKKEDKTGCLVIHEDYVKDSKFATYYASIDPVSDGKTVTSESLASIYIYKNPVEVTRQNADGTIETYLEGDKIVAFWAGRFDDVNKTNEFLLMIVEYYNAWTLCENNINTFINYCILHNKQKYLVPRSQMIFVKDLGNKQTTFQEYGWKNVGTIFTETLLVYLIDWLKEELDSTEDEKGNKRITYGITRLPDIMALQEMKAYTKGLNVDRLVSLAALIAFAKVQQANRGIVKRSEQVKEDLDKSKNLYKLKHSPFKNINRKGNDKIKRSPFKRLN